jgi:uncharacterized protein DUF5335
MKTRDIPRPEWSSFLDSFSRVHQGWLVRVDEIAMPAGPTAVEASGLPLLGVSYERSDDDIVIALAGQGDAHLTRVLHRPSRVAIEQTDDGIEQGVRIESESGPATRVTFRSAVRPEEVDGLPTS